MLYVMMFSFDGYGILWLIVLLIRVKKGFPQIKTYLSMFSCRIPVAYSEHSSQSETANCGSRNA